MNCEKCGIENLEGSKFCGNCGESLLEGSFNPIVRDENLTLKKKKLNKKMIMVSVACFVLMVIGITSYTSYTRVHAEKQYEDKFHTATIEIASELQIVEVICNTISSSWSSAISSTAYNADFNRSIKNLQEKFTERGMYDKIKTSKKNIDNLMTDLNKPSSANQEAYKLLTELYSSYGRIYEQSISPTGSLLTYNQDISNKKMEFTSTLDKLKVIKPDILKGLEETVETKAQGLSNDL
ncbi:zinc ribbon domain-containing protein [Clostridium cylindrosporum]|uniref:Zinc-ribbon domain-containing protein n=1 Tax=Clostridium cylindrosporum DSM 605 TaxID=1121307 RepID=A0A0J8D5Z5_CLOCY|nr:zinc ribbon domain-containing protein [Clostridium cylindrosporum]KMT21515.1 hypothetical protein CLCY_2c02760 [Clostridium cylindrosporum DSM 605]